MIVYKLTNSFIILIKKGKMTLMNKSNLLSIGEFSQLSRMTIKALHYYEKINLLHPAWIDPDSGYRYYDSRQLPYVQIIGLFTDLDIRLNHLTEDLYTEYLTADYKNLLAHSRHATKDKIEELNKKMRYIDYLEELMEKQDSPINIQNAATLWLHPCHDISKDINMNVALKQILHELKQYNITAKDNYGLIMFCNGEEKRLYYYMGIKCSSVQKNIHENIFYLPAGEYKKIQQTELDIKKIPSLFKDLFALPYDKIVLIKPEVSSYTISCLLPSGDRVN